MKRLYLIWGNHNREWKKRENIRKHLCHYCDERKGRNESLFEDIEIHEGLILRYEGTGNKIFLAHGHQGDLLNDSLWWLGRFVVRHIWKPLQILGFRDPTSPAKNFKKRMVVEKNIIEWVTTNGQMLIVGHTHRPMFPTEGEPPYFNCGSCVHPRCITGIEIQNGEITLIKWLVKPKDDAALDAPLHITREVIAGPRQLRSFFSK